MASQTITDTVPVETTLHIQLGVSEDLHSPGNAKSTNVLCLQNLDLDTTRALEPVRKKLVTIESQRIMAVIETSIKRAEIVTALPFVMENIERFRVSLGSELLDLINQHSRIQNGYCQIRKQLDDFLKRRATIIAAEERLAPLLSEEEERQQQKSLDEIEKSTGFESEMYSRLLESYQVGMEEVKVVAKISVKEGSVASKSRVDSAVISHSHSHRGSIEDRKGSTKESVANIVGQMIGDTGTERRHTVSELTDIEPRIEEGMRNLGLAAQQVSHSCKNILRSFSANPTAFKSISGQNNIRDEGGQRIVNSMVELKEILMHKLLTTPQEETEKMIYLDGIYKRERHNAAIIEKQEQELNAALNDREKEISKKNDIIKRLQTDLHQIEQFSNENIRRTRAEAEKKEIADIRNSDQKINKLNSEINQLQTQLVNAISEHRDIEADLRAKKYKVENEVDNWIQKYDLELGEQQDEYEENDLVYTDEKKQLLGLEERFATLEKEYLVIMEERQVSREKLDRAQRELALLVKSATTIQAFWRSYKVRKALKSKNKKKGKK